MVDVISGAECLEYFAGAAPTITGEHIDLGANFAYTRRGTARGHGGHRSVELPAPDRLLEVGAVAGLRQRHGVQAGRTHPGHGVGAG